MINMKEQMQPPVDYSGTPLVGLAGYDSYLSRPCVWCVRRAVQTLLGRDMKYYPDCDIHNIPEYAEDFFLLEGKDE